MENKTSGVYTNTSKSVFDTLVHKWIVDSFKYDLVRAAVEMDCQLDAQRDWKMKYACAVGTGWMEPYYKPRTRYPPINLGMMYGLGVHKMEEMVYALPKPFTIDPYQSIRRYLYV